MLSQVIPTLKASRPVLVSDRSPLSSRLASFFDGSPKLAGFDVALRKVYRVDVSEMERDVVLIRAVKFPFPLTRPEREYLSASDPGYGEESSSLLRSSTSHFKPDQHLTNVVGISRQNSSSWRRGIHVSSGSCVSWRWSIDVHQQYTALCQRRFGKGIKQIEI